MILIRALNGSEIAVDENAIILVSGPYPHDVGPHTYVHGVDPGVLVTADPLIQTGVELGRVNFGKGGLTPRRATTSAAPSAVTAVRPPLATETSPDGAVKAVVFIGGLHQAVREEVKTAENILSPPAATV